MISRLLFGLGLLCPLAAHGEDPYRFVIVTDGDPAYANQVVNYLRSTAPFSEMGTQVSFEVLQMDPAKMACKAGALSRLIDCNDKAISKFASKWHPNRILAVLNDKSFQFSGAGGSIPKIGPNYRLSVALHELVHSYGFGDEYTYTKEEAAGYDCGKRGHPRFFNNASIVPEPPYRDDAEARKKHHHQIPWYGGIAPSTLITSGNQLGTLTGIYPKDAPALYPGGDCNAVVPTWKPFYEKTVMEDERVIDLPPLYQDEIVKRMSAERGAEIKLVKGQCTECGSSKQGGSR